MPALVLVLASFFGSLRRRTLKFSDVSGRLP
jgi:hypothetical protein